MPKYRIFTVGFDLPGENFEYISFDSDQTLLDADIILFEPTLGSYYSEENYNGRPLLNEASSFKISECLQHWHSEIVAAVNSGKIVVFYLSKEIRCYKYTGRKDFSGTGRSRITTNIVDEISSYTKIPRLTKFAPKSGSKTRVEKEGYYIVPYWDAFSEISPYEMEIAGDFSRILLRSKSGDRVVGAAFHGKLGVLIFLPPLQINPDEFTIYNDKTDEHRWTADALKLGKKLASTLVAMADSIKADTRRTPAPDWAQTTAYRLSTESEIERSISAATNDIANLQTKKAGLEAELDAAGSLRGLLYEQGKPLEGAILETLALFKFAAEPFSDGESEFDAVFVCPEGRCIGESEGKDTKAINITKFSQLERNIHEDFERDDVQEYAKGVLFGNAYRLTPPEEREEAFTTKCFTAAKRTSYALVRTPDLFAPARYLKENPKDEKFAMRCREAILNTDGAVVVFPDAPGGAAETVADKQEIKAIKGKKSVP